jgi:hypothetical protein
LPEYLIAYVLSSLDTPFDKHKAQGSCSEQSQSAGVDAPTQVLREKSDGLSAPDKTGEKLGKAPRKLRRQNILFKQLCVCRVRLGFIARSTEEKK